MKYYKNKYSFEKMCQILKVDRSSYYKWLKKGKSKRQLYNEELLVLIKSGCLYGSPSLTAIETTMKALRNACIKRRPNSGF